MLGPPAYHDGWEATKVPFQVQRTVVDLVRVPSLQSQAPIVDVLITGP